MPRGAKPGERRGGRVAGTPNKATQERLLKQAMEAADAVKTGKKLAKDVLDDFMHLCAGMAAAYQPDPPDKAGLNPFASEEKFWKCVDATREFATALAKYQSPTFKAHLVHMAPEQQAKPLPPPGAGNVVNIDDPEALQRVYKRRIASVA